ncbi:DUF6538 domain-containing protein [Tropicimonas aquimaris]|uniref:DUF6538 domain-containing protein n=1 Tax=Tropicimonas aquimaris TaxID=914152 RepID=A0ABW3IQZ9_9RHOB
MKIFVEMDYLTTNRKSGKYKYRRRVPQELVATIGKREFSVSLRTSNAAEAARMYPEIHLECPI